MHPLKAIEVLELVLAEWAMRDLKGELRVAFPPHPHLHLHDIHVGGGGLVELGGWGCELHKCKGVGKGAWVV